MPSNKLRIPQFDYKGRNLFLIFLQKSHKKIEDSSGG